jgi:WD40 repeat protein
MAVINDTSMAVYDTLSGALKKKRELEKGLALDARFSPDGRYLVVEKESLENRSLTVLNAQDLSMRYRRYLSAGLFAISSDSKLLALVNEGGKLEFLDLDSGRQLLEGEAAAEGEGGSFELIFNRETDRLAVLTSRGIRLFDARSGRLIREMK